MKEIENIIKWIDVDIKSHKNLSKMLKPRGKNDWHDGAVSSLKRVKEQLLRKK